MNNDLYCIELPYRFNFNEVEITITVINQPISNLHVIGIYRSKTKVKISKFIDALNHLHDIKSTNPEKPTVLPGEFNANLLEDNCNKKKLKTCLIQEKGFTQLIKQYTTDNRTLIDHICTNVPHLVESAGVLESYYSDHKPVFFLFFVMSFNNVIIKTFFFMEINSITKTLQKEKTLGTTCKQLHIIQKKYH